MKIISQRREQARWAYDGAVLEVKKEIPDYLIQRNWVNAKGGYCALSWDE